MRDARKITCRNADGMTITFGKDFTPFVLSNCEGIYVTESNVVMSENTMTDGATYQGSTVRMRNIILTLSIKDNHQHSRRVLYSLFKPKSPGTFIYSEDGEEKQIEYYVEKLEITSTGNARTAIVSLLCPNPYFESTGDITVGIANWESLFEFAFEIPSTGIEFGAKSSAKARTIVNDCVDYTGVEIVIAVDDVAVNPIVNPVIYHMESGEFIKIGTDSKPLTISKGQKVVISTHTNNKHVYLVDADGTKTEINGYLDLDSEFIQLRNGKNTFGYSADSGEADMNIMISFRYKYLGV